MKGFVFFTSIGFLIGLWLFGGEMEQVEPHVINTKYDQKTMEYFREITLKNELNDKVKLRPITFKKDVKVFLEGKYDTFIEDEVNRVLQDLNAIIDPIELYTVDKKSDANMVVFLGDLHSFLTLNPDLIYSPQLNTCEGYFKLRTRGDEILFSRIFINLKKQEGSLDLQDCLREEITQSLGAINDSYRYPTSTFYQGENYVTEYSEMDVNVLKILYNGK
ncbi:MAG: DUF2927 domain-containing protein [Bacteroidetes bacterium]|nr:DUF2927 domain-containing protein [Bacteroidota bacterium]